MISDYRNYNVLIVSSSEKITEALANLLRDYGCFSIQSVTDIYSARSKKNEREFDFIIINSPVLNDFATDFAIETTQKNSSLTLIIAKDELYETIHEKMILNGIFVIKKPISLMLFQQTLDCMISSKERLKTVQESYKSVEDKITEMRIINRAKWVLIEKKGMTEPEAHKFIEKQAMNRSISKVDMAQNIIDMF